MDQRAFRFANRGQCIKRNKARLFLSQAHVLIFDCNALALFAFFAVPSSGKPKCALVDCDWQMCHFFKF